MAVTANQLVVAQMPEQRASYPVIASTKLYQGALVFLVPASGHASDVIAAGVNIFGGIAVAEADNSAGAAAAKNVEVYTRGTFRLPLSGAVAADVGDLVYATDNYTLTKTPTANTKVGKIVGFPAAGLVDVKIDAPEL